MNIERLVGYTHRTPTQFVKGAVVAPRNLVMVETTVIRPRRTIAPYAWILFRFGLQDPAEQTHGAAQFVISVCVGRATDYAAARPFVLGGLEGYVGFHRCVQLLGLPRLQLRPHPPLGLHQRLAKRVRFGVHIVGVENGLGDFFAQELRVPTAKAMDQRFQRG